MDAGVAISSARLVVSVDFGEVAPGVWRFSWRARVPVVVAWTDRLRGRLG
ncbi:MAG: hypothetical protein IPM13_07770 [Phycisphaerales bacterium]|nr:hypothetical protein [Phycisphaerales bacterium]